MAYQYCFLNIDFYNANKETIHALPNEVGLLDPRTFGGKLVGVRTVDVRPLTDNFTVIEPMLEDEDEHTYIARTSGITKAAISKTILGPDDCFFMDDERFRDMMIKQDWFPQDEQTQ